MKAQLPMTSNRIAMGRNMLRKEIFGRDPARQAIANRTPRKAPIHQVAITPHPKASRVGDCV